MKISKQQIIEALEQSIIKWEILATGVLGGYGYRDCPLCTLFNTSAISVVPDCTNCPVKLKTGHTKCGNSPYEDYAFTRNDMADAHNNNISLFTEDEKLVLSKLAQKEVEFLEELLAEYQQNCIRG